MKIKSVARAVGGKFKSRRDSLPATPDFLISLRSPSFIDRARAFKRAGRFDMGTKKGGCGGGGGESRTHFTAESILIARYAPMRTLSSFCLFLSCSWVIPGFFLFFFSFQQNDCWRGPSHTAHVPGTVSLFLKRNFLGGPVHKLRACRFVATQMAR